MAVCLVTGGADFIGSHLVRALVGHGHRVRVFDDLSTGSLANLREVEGRVEVVQGTVTDPEAVRRATQGVEVVFHQAALASVPRSVADPMATHLACATGTLHVLMAAKGMTHLTTDILRPVFVVGGFFSLISMFWFYALPKDAGDELHRRTPR